MIVVVFWNAKNFSTKALTIKVGLLAIWLASKCTWLWKAKCLKILAFITLVTWIGLFSDWGHLCDLDWSKIHWFKLCNHSSVHQIHWDNTAFLHIMKCWSEFGHECKSTSTITTSLEDKSQCYQLWLKTVENSLWIPIWYLCKVIWKIATNFILFSELKYSLSWEHWCKRLKAYNQILSAWADRCHFLLWYLEVQDFSTNRLLFKLTRPFYEFHSCFNALRTFLGPVSNFN